MTPPVSSLYGATIFNQHGGFTSLFNVHWNERLTITGSLDANGNRTKTANITKYIIDYSRQDSPEIHVVSSNEHFGIKVAPTTVCYSFFSSRLL